MTRLRAYSILKCEIRNDWQSGFGRLARLMGDCSCNLHKKGREKRRGKAEGSVCRLRGSSGMNTGLLSR